mgnify:CR=1 FL=1
MRLLQKLKRMKISYLVILFIIFGSTNAFGQGVLSKVKTKKFKTTTSLKIEGETGYLIVPENRDKPDSRRIKIKYVRLKSLSQNPATPVVYLEGGSGASTWQVDSPKDLSDWLEVLEVSDLIFFDQRGTNDESLNYYWKGDYPKNFLVSEEQAFAHYKTMSQQASIAFKDRKVDPSGYHVVAHADDVHDLTKALKLDKYSLYGFSFGSHIGMTLMKRHPAQIERAVFIGADAPNQSFNFPSHLDTHLDKVSNLVAQDSLLSLSIPDFKELVADVMKQLKEEPAVVTVKNPLTRKDIDLPIGPFGLSLLLRLDIDDSNDIPAIPRLIYSIKNKNYDMLTWFVQKRMVFGLVFPGKGINQGLASGVSNERWSIIQQEANESIFSNVVNFPFSAAKDHWATAPLALNTLLPLKTDIPTLFVSGTLDARTPVEQVEETIKGFSNAIHIKVKYAGHEQAMWNAKTFNKTIPAFLTGKQVEEEEVSNGIIKFLALEGPTNDHPSIKQ